MRSRATYRLGQTRREPKKANPRFRLSGDGVLEGETQERLEERIWCRRGWLFRQANRGCLHRNAGPGIATKAILTLADGAGIL